MKRFCFFVLLLYVSGLFAQKETTIPLKIDKAGVEIISTKSNNFQVKCKISSLLLKSKETSQGLFEELIVNSLSKVYTQGEPEIPMYSKLIEIPTGDDYEVNVVSYDIEVVDLYEYGITSKIAPAQQSISKNDDKKKTVFYLNENSYKQNKFIENELISIENIGMMRDVRIGRLEIRPIQYNPVENKIKVFNNLLVEIKFIKGTDTNRDITKRYSSHYFKDILENSVIHNSTITKELTGANPIKYVIISDPMFKAVLQPFIAWKTIKGFVVEARYTDDAAVGSTCTSIKSFLKNAYTSPADGIPHTFLLLVGDVAQIPAFPGTIPGEDHVTDLYYAEYTDDNLPDVYYGRFSATSVSELQPQIDKTMQLEQVKMPDINYLADVVLVAGVDNTFAPVNGNGAINYANQYYTNTTNSINSNYYLYNNTSGIMASNNPDASASIRSKISQGVSFVNYTAHCSPNGWVDPSFSISNISGLSNLNKYPLIIGNCCQTAKFELSSFAEELLRAKDKGAVGYIGGSDYTYWDEDYWWAIGLTSIITVNPTYEDSGLGAYDKFFHLRGESKQNWAITMGQMLVAGNLAVESSNSMLKKYYWEIYHLMGDPSLTVPVSIPTMLNVVHDANVTMGNSDFTVSIEKDAFVALSMDGILIDSKLSNELNIANLSTSKISKIGTLDIVATKQNRIPYISHIPVINTSSDFQQPTVPSNLIASNITQTGLTLTWTASTDNIGVTRYDIYQGNALKGSSTSNSFTVTNLTCASSFNFTIKARDLAGNASNTSNIANATTLICPDIQPPTAPSNLLVTSISQTGLTLTWTPSTDNIGVSGYDIYQDDVLKGTSTTTSFVVLGIICNTNYSFTIKAKDASGNISTASNQANTTTSACPDIQAPTVPADFKIVTTTSNSVSLSWKPSLDDTGVVEYDIYKGLILDGNSTVNSYIVKGLTSNTEYKFSVKARDAAGNVSESSSEANVVTLNEASSYCSSQSSNYSVAWIAGVQVSNLNKRSDASSYSDFTGEITYLPPNSLVSFSLFPGFASASYKLNWVIWIDYNKNGSFTDDGEQVFEGSSSGSIVGSISVPSSVNGNTRMRISMRYNATPISCGSIDIGEVEDYTVYLGVYNSDTNNSNNRKMNFNIFPNPNDGDFRIVLPSGIFNNVIISVYNMHGELIFEETEQPRGFLMEIPLTLNVIAGVYTVLVETENSVLSKILVVR